MSHSSLITDHAELFRVLVVDDEPIVHDMMARILDDCGLPVTLAATASSGAEALSAARKIRPHICLLDIHMGEMDGLELANQLKNALNYQPVIIYVTAYRNFEYAQQAVKLGASDYIVKPIRRQDVLDALGKVVQRIEAERLKDIEKERLKEYLGEVMPAVVAQTEPAAEGRKSSVVRAAREFVDKYYARDIALTSAADHLNLSPGYLGPLFKSEYGITFKAYLRRVRIARAKELMADQRLNLSQIAQKVGYEDISYFSQSFLEETGVRPSEYRGGGKRWPK